MTEFRSGPLLTLAIGILVCLTVYKLCYIVYDVYFGPLSKFPGPKLAAATRLVFTWHKIHGDADHWTVSLHARYGDIVRRGPRDLSFATGHAWKDIYGHSTGSKTQQFPKDLRFYGNRDGHDIIFSDEANHTRFRRNFAHAFSDRALKQQEPLLRQYVDELISKLSDMEGGDVDLVRWYNYTTFDIMGDLTFGEPLGCLSKGEYTPWVTSVFQSAKVGAFLTETRYLPLLKPLINSYVSSSSKESRQIHFQNSYNQVDKRLAKEDARPDIWGIVLNAKESQKLTLPEMRQNSQIFMFAGTETTATLLSGLTYCLLMNPAKMAKVTQEIREAFESADQIGINSVLRLKYLNACFEEGLRCYPPVPSGLPRLVPKGGDIVCGHPMPEDTIVAVHQLSTYRNPSNFKRPTEFIPERWLDDPEFQNDHKAALQPFSVGPRNCLGRNLAYLEMRLILSNVLWHFDLSLCDESRNWTDQKTFTLWEKNPLKVNLRQVLRHEKR